MLLSHPIKIQELFFLLFVLSGSISGSTLSTTIRPFDCFSNSTLQHFSHEGTRYCNSGFPWSKRPSLCCADTEKDVINIQTLHRKSIENVLKARNERVLFIGESCTRGIFQDFVRIVSHDKKFAVNNHHSDPYCKKVRLQKNSVEACYTLIPGTLQKKWVNGINLTAYQLEKLREEPLDKLSRIFVEKGNFSLVVIGMTTWDMLLVDRVDIYLRELLKLCEISKSHGARVLLRGSTPLGEPTANFQGTNRGLTWNARALLYNKAIRQVAAFERVQVLDLYNKMHEYAKFNENLWQDKKLWIKNYWRSERKCAKFASLKNLCSSIRYPGNFLHLTCSKCDGSDGNGYFSSIFAQGVLFFLLQDESAS